MNRRIFICFDNNIVKILARHCRQISIEKYGRTGVYTPDPLVNKRF